MRSHTTEAVFPKHTARLQRRLRPGHGRKPRCAIVSHTPAKTRIGGFRCPSAPGPRLDRSQYTFPQRVTTSAPPKPASGVPYYGFHEKAICQASVSRIPYFSPVYSYAIAPPLAGVIHPFRVPYVTLPSALSDWRLPLSPVQYSVRRWCCHLQNAFIFHSVATEDASRKPQSPGRNVETHFV